MSRLEQGFNILRTALAVVLLAAAGLAQAAVAPPDQDKYSIPLRQFDLFNYTSAAVEQAKTEAAASFASVNGGHWFVYSWNPQTNTPSNLYGSGVATGKEITTAQEAVDAARAAIQTNPKIFNFNPANLRFEVAPHALGKWAVHFQQTYKMLDVWGGRVRLTFTDHGRLFALGSQFYHDITVDPNPSIPVADAEALAARDLPFNPLTDGIETGSKLLILPVPISETKVEYHLVWRVKVRTQDPVGVWVTHVDAHSGQILWRFNDVDFANFVGTTQGLIERPSYCEGQTPEALPYLRIQVAGLGSTYADASGNWSLLYGGSDARTVTADLYSPYVDVNNIGGGQGTFSGVATPGVPLQVNFTDSNSQKDEKDVYQAVQDIHNFYELFAPGYSYTNARITANVSRNSTCNAYWDGTINFYIEGGGCANTGRIMGVVYHEYGHGIQNNLVGQQGDQGLGEGNGDINANLLTMESIIGRGFYLNDCVNGIRNSKNTLRYPNDVIGQEIHYAGQVIAGFHWDAMEALIQVYGTEPGRLLAASVWHNARRLERPLTQPDQVLASFIADDDNGDLTDGTPHYDEFCLGATNHGFSCPQILHGVLITHTPLQTTTTEGNTPVVATIYSTEGALVADSVRVRYRVNGGDFQWVPMAPTGNLNEYRAILPNLTQPSSVDYYIRARDIHGNTATDPGMAPLYLHSFDVARVWDTLEVASGWTVNLEGGDNATTGVWIQADPVGTSAQPEDDHTPDPGHICFVTGNANPGDGDGTNDVDNGTTTLYSPVYDLSGSSTAQVKYWRWYSNDRGGAPNEDTWAVQVRNNGGPWQDVERTTQSSDSWVQIASDLYAMFGGAIGQVQFKFIASDLINPSLVEAAVDDFELLAASGNVSVPGETSVLPARFALLGSRPNPAIQGAAIEFSTASAVPVRLTVFDVTGRAVRTLANGPFAAGLHQAFWDGKDGEGRLAASGVYFVRMEAGGFKATRSVVLSR